MRESWYQFLFRKAHTIQPDYSRPKYRVVDCNGDNPPYGRVDSLGDHSRVEFYTWEEAVIYVNDHSLHIVEEK